MFFSKQRGSAPSVVSSPDGSVWRSLIGSGSNSSGSPVTPESALGVPILQNCVTLLAESIAQLPLELYHRKGNGQRDAAINHPLYDVLRYQPNGFQTPYEHREGSQLAVGLRGNSYSFMERRDDGNVTALWPIHNDKVIVYKGGDMLPYYQIGAFPDRLPMRQIHHVRWHSQNFYEGMSPIMLHAEAVGLAQAVRQYTGKSFANGVSVSGVIERPREAPAIKDQGSIDRVLDQWGNKFGGMDNAKKVAMLQEGMTFRPVSMTNVDAEIVGILKLSGVDCARIYKIPLPMVNDLDKANYNTIEQLLIQFVVFSLLPWVNRSKATLWGQMTEGAIDRIDGVFANAWANIGSGADSLWDNLVKGAKQAFGEIAHMLTTKPLLASISNWLTGTDNGQGVSSVWGKLLGSAGGSPSGGSGGGLFSGLAGIGKNLYSAWNAITGVGASVASGYASGGIGGAISGGAGYYSNMLSNIASTLSGGFTSLIGGNIAITGATAAGTAATTAALSGVTAAQAAAAAATVGAEGITAASLSAAVAEGAASIGTNIGVAGATTAAASQGIGAAISSAISSAAAMWPLAIIMGMYQSGKLYSAGVRPDAGEMWDSAGHTALGKVTMLPQTLAAKYFEVTDNLLGKVVGGKMAAIFSGSTLFQAVWSKVGSKLFGSGYQTKDQGIQLGVTGGDLQAYQYQDQKKKGGLISGSSKKRTLLSPLDAATQKTVQDAFDTRLNDVFSLFDTLNVDVPAAALDGLNMAAWKISVKDLTTDQVNQLFSDFFEVLGNEAVGAISKSMGLGLDTYNVDQLTEFARNLYSINDTFKLLNVNALPVSVWGGKLAEQYVALAGGMEAFNTATQTYYGAFFSDAEKSADTLAAIKKQFADLNVTFPSTREGFRAVVEGLDSTTDAGREMFIKLMGLAGSASTAYDILKQQSDAAAAAVQALSEKLLGVVNNANSDLQRAISAQQKATTEAYNKQVAGLNDMVSTVTENVTGLTSIGNNLSAALKALRGDSDDAVKMLRAQAQATLQSALAKARSGGSLVGFAGLEDALDTVSNNNTDLYGSLEEYARDQGRTANVVAELNGINGKQLTAAEKSLKGLEEQIKQAKAGYDLQMAQYDQQLAFAQAQMDALNGVDNSVMGVTAAINAMNAAVVAALAGMGGKGATNSAATNGTFIDSVYKDVLGRDADAAGKNYWLGELANGHLTLDQLAQAIANAAKEKNQAVKAGYATGGHVIGPGTGTSDSIFARLSNGEYVMKASAVSMFGTGLLDQMNAGQLPAFAVGGVVGDMVPQLDIIGPAQIFEANRAAAMSGNDGDLGAVLAELQITRAENKEQRFQIAKYSQQVAQLLQKFDAEGLPQERDYA